MCFLGILVASLVGFCKNYHKMWAEIRKYSFIFRYQSQPGRSWLLLFCHVNEKSWILLFSSPQGSFPPELAKTQPEPPTHICSQIHCWGKYASGFLGILIMLKLQYLLIWIYIYFIFFNLTQKISFFFYGTTAGLFPTCAYAYVTQTSHKGKFRDHKLHWWYATDFSRVKVSQLIATPHKIAAKKHKQRWLPDNKVSKLILLHSPIPALPELIFILS